MKALLPSLQRRNDKMEKTWNMNLPPHLTCVGRKCFEEGCCYNLKAWVQYDVAKLSWVSNWLVFTKNPKEYFDYIIARIHNARVPLKHFRWHASGDIPNQKYLEGMKRVARECPCTDFLVFTKNFNLTFREIPENLQVIISAWPGVALPRHLRRRFPVAWFIDGRENRFGKKKIAHCPGSCDGCRKCWNLTKTQRDVQFIKH